MTIYYNVLIQVLGLETFTIVAPSDTEPSNNVSVSLKCYVHHYPYSMDSVSIVWSVVAGNQK